MSKRKPMSDKQWRRFDLLCGLCGYGLLAIVIYLVRHPVVFHYSTFEMWK